jgi:hypothetical protein
MSFPIRPRLTYAIAPPNRSTAPERRREIAAAQSARIAALPIDALLVYDVQDETARNAAPRPFPFVPKVDPLAYAYDALTVGAMPRIVYRATAEQNEPALCRWLDALRARGGLAVLVGAPSTAATTSLTLPQALSVCRRHSPELRVGGVLIPERHQSSGDEDARVWSKVQQGCRFFVSQTVWCATTTRRFLKDLRIRAEQERQAPPPILLTLSPCGSPQTLDFLEWLGVAVPASIKRELLGSKDMLARSIELASDAFAEIHAFARAQGLHVGCNVESLTARGSEIDASLELLRCVDRLDRPALPRPLAAPNAC